MHVIAGVTVCEVSLPVRYTGKLTVQVIAGVTVLFAAGDCGEVHISVQLH